MRLAAVLLVVFFIRLTLPGAPAEAQTACEPYSVQPGDTLAQIALRAYEDPTQAETIYRANVDLIGPDPNIIERNMVLRMPCAGVVNIEQAARAAGRAGGAAAAAALARAAEAAIAPEPAAVDAADLDSLPRLMPPGARADAGAAAAVEAPETVPSPAEAVAPAAGAGSIAVASAQTTTRVTRGGRSRTQAGIVLLTGGPYPPYIVGNGGLMVDLVTAALAASDAGSAVDIAVVNDRAALLAEVMPRGGFDASFPWVQPDCAYENLTPEEDLICREFIASDPFYEQLTEFYALTESPYANAIFFEDLVGARICRTDGMPDFDLRRAGLLPNRATLIRAGTIGDCLRMLDAGEVDVASLDGGTTRAVIDGLQVRNPILVLENLSTVETMRVLVSRGVGSEALLAQLNAGLERIGETGQWFEIVQRNLQSAE